MKYPPRHHYGMHTPVEPSQKYGKFPVNASLPWGLREHIPNPDAVRDAILAAPHGGDLPEPPGKCIDSYVLRLPSEVYAAFEEKRDGLARGAYLRRILYWRWGT